MSGARRRRARVRAPLVLCLAAAWLPARGVATTVVVAGDVAQCQSRPASFSAAAATARLVPDNAAVILLGDSAYPTADARTLASCYAPTWGAFLSRTYAVPGNHDYVHGSADAFFDYFGRRSPQPGRYRVALDGWWLIGLDSNGDARALAEQLAWLRAELAAIRGDGRCIVAAWHHPLYSTGLHAGDGDRMRPAWAALADAGADLVLSGHEHFYEAFAPKDALGRDSPDGLREFVVGTGGARLTDVSLSPWRHRAYARRHGVLSLDLVPGRYRWRFVDTRGATLDRGESACHAAAQSR